MQRLTKHIKPKQTASSHKTGGDNIKPGIFTQYIISWEEIKMLHLAPTVLALLLLTSPIQTKDATVTYSDTHLTQYTTMDGNVYEFTDRPEKVGTGVVLVISGNDVKVFYI